MSAETRSFVAFPGGSARRAGRRDELEFLPAAIEIIETPASPLGRAISGCIILFFCLAIAWAVFGHVDIIAAAQGKIVPVGRIKSVQPFEAGTVTAIHVRDGDRVHAGDVLVELDPTVAIAERNRIRLDMIRSQLDVARLRALRLALESRSDPSELFVAPDAPVHEVARARGTMLAQFQLQQHKLAALDKQIAQKAAESEEIEATIEKIKAGLPILEETADIREKAMKMEYGNRIAHLEAQLRLSEQRHELLVQQRRAVESLEARNALVAQREQTQSEYARSIMSDLAEAEPKAGQFAEDYVKATKRMTDQTLRAPTEGIVQQLAVHTVGGVVTAAQPLMAVVPIEEGLEIEATLPNKDVGFVHEGQEAAVKIDTFNFTKYGLLRGSVVNISRDAVQRDRSTGLGPTHGSLQAAQSAGSEPPMQELIYTARLSLDRTQMQIEGNLVDLSPGMAVTAEIKTGQRRVIEYLLSPILKHRHESLRER